MVFPLPELMGRLDTACRRTGAPIAVLALPGATSEQLDTAEHALGFALPADVRAWFSWHNGQRFDDGGGYEPTIGGCFWLYSVERCVAHRQEGLDFASRYFPAEADEWYAPSWFPLAESAPGLLFADCAAWSDGGSPVGLQDKEEIDYPSAEPTLTELVALWVDTLESGAGAYDPAHPAWLLDQVRLRTYPIKYSNYALQSPDAG